MDIARIVPATTTQRWSRRRFMGGAVRVAALGSFAAACSGLSRRASCGRRRAAASGTSPTTPQLHRGHLGVDAGLISQRYVGLKPFAPAPPPGRQADHAERV